MLILLVRRVSIRYRVFMPTTNKQGPAEKPLPCPTCMRPPKIEHHRWGWTFSRCRDCYYGEAACTGETELEAVEHWNEWSAEEHEKYLERHRDETADERYEDEQADLGKDVRMEVL
jgi:hypothetical protein